MREVDFTKKRLQQEFEDKLEVEQQNKRQLERRVRLVEGVEAGPGVAWCPVEPGMPWEHWGGVGGLASWGLGMPKGKLLFKCVRFPNSIVILGSLPRSPPPSPPMLLGLSLAVTPHPVCALARGPAGRQ